MNKQFLESQIASLTSRRDQLAWLKPYLDQAEKIANFGCAIGGETLALMWLFQAREAVGLDTEPRYIREARDQLHQLKQDINEAHRAKDYPWTSNEERDWWANAPAFFTKRIIAPDFNLEYWERDIIKPTRLPDNCYDLAFCDFVLHHIWYDAASGNGEQDAQRAINEMARVVRPGGIVAAHEVIQYDGKPRLDFARLFEHSGLEQVHVQEDELEDLGRWEGKYVFRKRT